MMTIDDIGTPGSPRSLSFSSFGRPGSPPPSPKQNSVLEGSKTPPNIFDDFQECLEEQDRELLSRLKQRPILEQCEALEELFKGRTETMHYYRDKVDEQQREMDDMLKDYKRKVRDVTTMWRDKIYNEHTRAGKIFKNALLKS